MSQGFSGVGLVKSHTRTSGGDKGIGRFWGNCPKYEIAMNPDSVERKESMTPSRSPLRRMTRATAAAVTIVTDEFNKANFAQANAARVDEVAADPGVTINWTFPTGAIVGDVLGVPQTNITTQVITDSSGSPKTLVAGVNYDPDLFAGDITLLDLTTGGPFVQPFKSAHEQGAVTVIAGLAIATTEIWITMAGTNVDSGLRGVLDNYRVRLDPAKVFQYINDDYTDMELTGTCLIDSTKLASSVGGQVFKFSMPSDHE
jgi:hypothetical protein